LSAVLVVDRIDAEAERRLARSAEILRPAADDVAALAAAARDADAIIVRTSRLPAEVLAAGAGLRVVGKHGVGLDNIDVPFATERGIVVIHTPAANAIAVAEFTLACMLVLLRPIAEGRAALRSGAFSGNQSLVAQLEGAGLLGGELSDRRIGVVGWGTIGRRVGAVLAALGAVVLVHDPYVSADGIRASGGTPTRTLDELLVGSDIVTVHVPATPATASLLGERELGLMKPHAILINTSRGSVVDEEALAATLRENRLRAAAVDVYSAEPPSPDHPLLGLENALCTPHMAGATVESTRRMANEVVDGVLAVLAGRTPPGVANPEALGIPRTGREVDGISSR
jgi:phosphoglycerate dehydrogenase-like enzyme